MSADNDLIDAARAATDEWIARDSTIHTFRTDMPDQIFTRHAVRWMRDEAIPVEVYNGDVRISGHRVP